MESDQCVNCSGNFDQFYKQRIMIPCGDSICLQCFDIFLQPQNELECMKCGETSNISARFKQKVMELKQNMQTIGVFCDTHPALQAEKYCSQHNVLICTSCAFDTHREHPQFVKDTKRVEIEKFCDNAVGYLITLRDRITSLVESMTFYKSKDKSLTSSFLMATVKEAQEILTQPFLKTDQEKLNIQFLTDNRDPKNKEELKQPQNAFAHNLPKKEEIKQPQNAFVQNLAKKEEAKQIMAVIKEEKVIVNPGKAFDFDFDNYSRDMFKITEDEQVFLKEWIGRPVKFKLTYRGTRDGFGNNSYANKCSGIAPILVLIKSEHNQVFGGFTSIKRDGQRIGCQADPSAFIFSLTKKTKHSQFQNQHLAIYYGHGWGSDDILIGFGFNDIRIYTNCDKNSSSSSDIGSTYKPIGEEKQGSNECQTYLAGSKNFKVIEMEVYQCI